MAALTDWVQAGLPITELPATLQTHVMACVQATGLVVVGLGGTLCVGQTPPQDVLADLPTWLDARIGPQKLFTTCELSHDFPLLAGFPAAETSAGLLAIPLSDDAQHHMFWFRTAAPATEPDHQRERSSGVRCSSSSAWLADCVDKACLLAAIFRSHLAFQKLQQSQAAQRLHDSIFDFCNDAILVTDAQNTILSANSAAVTLTGYRVDELVGATPALLKSGRHGTPFYSAMWRMINSTGRWQGEVWNRRKNGELCAHALSIKTLHNEDGTVWRRIGRLADITARKLATTALLESEMRWQFAVECNGEAMWDWNVVEDKIFTTVAAAAVLGLPAHTHTFQISDMVARVVADDRPKVQAAIHKLQSGKSSELQIEFRVSAPGEALRWVSTRGRVMTRNERGMPQRVVSISKDMTQQHIKESEYRNQTELLSQQARLVLIGEMASIFAHEINQPLAAIAALAAGCKRKAAALPDVRLLAQGIEEQALRGGDIAWRMLDFSRRQRSGRRAVSLPQLVSKIPGWIALQHSQAEIVVEIDQVSPDLPPIYAAPVEIEQVLLNLVRNAMDAGVSNSKVQRVVISTQLDNELKQVVVDVTDWGCGLPDAELFTTMKSFESSKEQGVGLGLTVCISIVQAHGGRIWATANPEGGTIVHFSVPLFDPHLHHQAPHPAPHGHEET